MFIMALWVAEFSSRRPCILQLNFENWVNGKVSKIGHHFRKYSFQKMSTTKSVPLKWYSCMKSVFKKIGIIFDIEN